jgi:hypothetical protein
MKLIKFYLMRKRNSNMTFTEKVGSELEVLVNEDSISEDFHEDELE